MLLELMEPEQVDQIERFIATSCVFDPGAMTPRSEIWTAFEAWLGPQSWWRRSEVRARQFSEVIVRHGVRRKTIRRRGAPVRVYQGVRLLRVEDLL